MRSGDLDMTSEEVRERKETRHRKGERGRERDRERRI